MAAHGGTCNIFFYTSLQISLHTKLFPIKGCRHDPKATQLNSLNNPMQQPSYREIARAQEGRRRLKAQLRRNAKSYKQVQLRRLGSPRMVMGGHRATWSIDNLVITQDCSKQEWWGAARAPEDLLGQGWM